MYRNNRLKNRVILPFIFLSVVGCTTSYKPNSQVVPVEELAHYNPKDFANRKEVSNSSSSKEDEWIMKAIFYEQSNNFKKSNYFYKKLYDTTGKDAYLLKELKTALYSGVTSENISKLKGYISKHPKNLLAKRLILTSYIYAKRYEEAKEMTSSLLSQSQEARDFELSATPYIFTKDYNRAVELLKDAYNKSYNENILLKTTTILVNYLRDTSQAISLLENHRLNKQCSQKICSQLISIYFQQNDIEKIVPIYKSLYRSTRKEKYAEKVVEGYLHLKDYGSAIEFLKKEYNNPEMLYSLYIESKSFDKADKLSRKLIKETKEPKWYAESAMVLYESTTNKDDKAMLKEVINRFEIAMKMGIKNTVYLNYYGYLLIDKNIDIKKGIRVIKKALEEQPENSAYLDSLALGYYKLGDCKESLNIMTKVIKIEGLKEEEIRNHWDLISTKCKK